MKNASLNEMRFLFNPKKRQITTFKTKVKLILNTVTNEFQLVGRIQ